ncbi:hypothetical protein ACIPR8_06895 [Stenotrophomonas sp. LARHCG68]
MTTIESSAPRNGALNLLDGLLQNASIPTAAKARLRTIRLHLESLIEREPKPAAAQEAGLTFASFRAANVSRCEKWHPAGICSWSPSDWLTAAMGELGELASEVKMHNRVRDGLIGNKEELSPTERRRRMANEAADVVTYLDLFCAERGIDLGDALIRKFNEVSERVGFPERLAATPVAAAPGVDVTRVRALCNMVESAYYDTGEFKAAVEEAREVRSVLDAIPAAQEAVAWVPPTFFDPGCVAATARRKPPSETAVATRGEYVPLYATPVAAAPVDGPYQRIKALQGIGDAADYLARNPGDAYAMRRLRERLEQFAVIHGASTPAAPELVRLLALLEQWEQRSSKALPADAMLINKHIRELGSVLRGENLLNQHGVAIVAYSPQVVPSPALGAHEVHAEAVHAGFDLGEAGERLVAADALEHASGVRQNCDGSATAPEGFVLVPEVMDLDMEVAFCEAWFSKRRCIDDPEMQDAWAAALAARPQGVKE